jgi:hypothetical protein
VFPGPRSPEVGNGKGKIVGTTVSVRRQWRRENRWDDRRQRRHRRVLAESMTTIWGRRRHRLVSNIRGSGRIVVVLSSMRDHRSRVGGGRGGGSGGVG